MKESKQLINHQSTTLSSRRRRKNFYFNEINELREIDELKYIITVQLLEQECAFRLENGRNLKIEEMKQGGKLMTAIITLPELKKTLVFLYGGRRGWFGFAVFWVG